MESSDKFDDFMKALGVGMIKRKLANSVVPINEVRNSILLHWKCFCERGKSTFPFRWRFLKTDCT